MKIKKNKHVTYKSRQTDLGDCMSSARLWSPAGTRRTANRSERKPTPPTEKKKKKISPLFQTSRHSNPKSNAPSGSLSVKPADVFMMSTDEPLREIKVLFGGVRLHERREERRGERGDSDLSSHC